MSLRGLVRHLTSVENYWLQYVIAGHAGDRFYSDPSGADLAFVLEPDADMVDEAWSAWRRRIARSDDAASSRFTTPANVLYSMACQT